MNVPGVISITDHTHFRGNKREAYLFRSLVKCSMVQYKTKEAQNTQMGTKQNFRDI